MNLGFPKVPGLESEDWCLGLTPLASLCARAKKVSIVCVITPRTPFRLRDFGSVLGRLNPQVKPFNGRGVHLGLPTRPRTPRPHPSPGLVQRDRVGEELPSRATGGHINRRGMGDQVGGSYLLLFTLLSLVGTLPEDSRSTLIIYTADLIIYTVDL